MNHVIEIFNEAVTSSAIKEIEEKHKGLVHDFTNEEEFKAARKVRAEMNKLLEQVDRVGIDAAAEVTEKRKLLKDEIERAYSGTVQPFLIENQKRLDEAKRIKKEKDDRIREQNDKLKMIKGASARAIHLPIGDIEDILQDVMGIDVLSFDKDMQDEAKTAKEISLAQLKDAFEFAKQKEDMRKAKELQDAELADKQDEIERMRAQIAALTGASQNDVEPQENIGDMTIKERVSNWAKEKIHSDDLDELLAIIACHISLQTTEN